jgi:hypothetical protein
VTERAESPRRARRVRPPAVRVFDEALADWLASFTMPEALAGEMADACAEGAPWAAAAAGVAARRAGWLDAEALAWGLCVGGLAGALEAAGRSLAGAPPAGASRAAGPALPLLAADGLVAAAHETLGSLEPGRVTEALAALGREFGDGGPWRALAEGGSRPTWAAMVACALAPAAEADPSGPWEDWAEAWDAWYGPTRRPFGDGRELWDHPRGDADTKALLRGAAREAAREGDA